MMPCFSVRPCVCGCYGCTLVARIFACARLIFLAVAVVEHQGKSWCKQKGGYLNKMKYALKRRRGLRISFRKPRQSVVSSCVCYHIFRRSVSGMNILSPCFTLNASYHALMCCSAAFTRFTPREWGSIFVRLRISSSVMFAAHSPA